MVISRTVFTTPAWRELGRIDKLLLLYLDKRHNEKNGRLDPSHKTIRTDLGIGRTALIAALARLTARGWIKRTPRHGPGISTQYEIVPPIGTNRQEIVPDADTISKGNSAAPCTEIVPPSDTQKEKERRINNIYTTIPQVPAASSDAPEPGPGETDRIPLTGLHEDYIEKVKTWLNGRSKAWWDEQRADFPAIDPLAEARHALNWLKTKQKRRAKICKFFRNWFAKAQRDMEYRRQRRAA